MDLICTVSLLSNFEQAKNYLDWEVGVHGLIARFHDPYSREGKERQATLLPDVILEEGLDKIGAIDLLIEKAGYEGPSITDELRRSVRLERYQSTYRSMTYEEYAQRKAMAGKNGFHLNY
eukprot:TRINITY_DN24311_c0_g1_i1.p4 TRINITY_DN24311_c0_g1~~TRINITY_DN24311_c0_g1_i1.p4  ORF type:complete len:120 (+),score=15.69 TRINITY_DN24311_c0_g1_i1:371-730(+)